ncbi:unnamed protein product [Amoebophrya sp. A120]|nr:unnamed protein product [Amoebophrya sp. A120]|eukprot:GSA120T00002984001.1
MRGMSVTTEGFFNTTKPKPSYSKSPTRQPQPQRDTGVSLPRLPPPESHAKAKGSRSGWRSGAFEKLPNAGGGWHPLPYPKRELEPPHENGNMSEEDPIAGGNSTHLSMPPEKPIPEPAREKKRYAEREAASKNFATTFSGGFNLPTPTNGNSKSTRTSFSGESGFESVQQQDGAAKSSSSTSVPSEIEEELRQDNERLRRELETLQVGLLQSLKRQDRFISGGQFKGPPAKHQNDKNKMASTHQGSFLGDKSEEKARSGNKASAFHIAELKRYKARVQELTRELQDVRKEQLELSDMKSLYRTLEEENRILKEQIRLLKDEQIEIAQQHEAEIARLKEQVREDFQDLSPVYAEMAQVIAARDGLASEIETYRRELYLLRENVKVEAEQHASKLRQLEENLAQAVKEKTELEHSLERWKRKLNDATRKFRELEQESERNAEERDRLHGKALGQMQQDHEVAVRALQSEISTLKNQIASLKDHLSKAQAAEDEKASLVKGAKEEWEAERIAMEHRHKLELQHTEGFYVDKLDGKTKEYEASLEQRDVDTAKMRKGLEQRCQTLETEHKEQSKKLYEMALMHFLASAQQKNKGPEQKVVFSLWKAVARDQAGTRRESELAKDRDEQINALRKQAEREQNQLRVAVEEDKKNRETLDRLKEEERKKNLVEKLSETARVERAKCQKEHEKHEQESKRVTTALKERNSELEAIIRELEGKMEELEKNVLQRKLQQSMKLQVLAPRVSVTINGDTVNMMDVEVAPSSEDLKQIMHKEVLPRFSKILLSEDFDESRTQARVQEVMNNMVQVIENKLQGIFGANCLRTTAAI